MFSLPRSVGELFWFRVPFFWVIDHRNEHTDDSFVFFEEFSRYRPFKVSAFGGELQPCLCRLGIAIGQFANLMCGIAPLAPSLCEVGTDRPG